jgi:hypothetical protein
LCDSYEELVMLREEEVSVFLHYLIFRNQAVATWYGVEEI